MKQHSRGEGGGRVEEKRKKKKEKRKGRYQAVGKTWQRAPKRNLLLKKDHSLY